MKRTSPKRAHRSRTQGKGPVWDLRLLYSSRNDPAIEKDARAYEQLAEKFSRTYDTSDKRFLSDVATLKVALEDYEQIIGTSPFKGIMYFHYAKDLDARDSEAAARLALYANRMTKADNKLTFFEVLLGTLDGVTQQRLLADPTLEHFHVFLSRVFADAVHALTVPEEKIMNLKSLPAYDLWVSATEKILHTMSVKWNGRRIPLSAATQMIPNLASAAERRRLARAVNEVHISVAPFAEAELNAVCTNKKINDEIRGYSTPYESTVDAYRNDPAVVERLRNTVTKAFPIAHRFFSLKKRLLKQKQLAYSDRAAKIGTIARMFPFDDCVALLTKTFDAIDPKYPAFLKSYLDRGQIDAPPRVGKTSGAYCSSTYGNPTFVLLNHTDDLRSLTTFAHEMGHAFHGELSEKQGPIYSNYSTALAETASTLFESIALEAVYESLSDNEKMIALHDKISDDISTVFRQIACFNFELDLHAAIRTKGSISKEEIAELHNKNMKAYLGPAFTLELDDGYFFVQWSHIRRFFYVYSYAYGQLVTKALLRRYRADTSFWSSIEKFLAAGGSDSPENILRSIGIDPASSGFWEDGLNEIEDDIQKLEKLARK